MPEHLIEVVPKIKCKCGCGLEIEPVNRHGRPRRYALGHNACKDVPFQGTEYVCKKCNQTFVRTKTNKPKKKMCTPCYDQCRHVEDPIKSLQHRDRLRKYQKTIRPLLRDRAIEILGNQCNCCGEKHIYFLSIDHVNNDGNIDRKKRSELKMLRDIIENESSRINYQILCYNCNISKGIYGICPHILLK